MNMYQMYVPVNQIVASRSAELHQAQKCRICLSGRNLREIYTGGDLNRQQLIEQHSTRLLASHELPRFICEGCEDVIIFYQTMVSKRERAEGLMQAYVFGGGAWPEVQEMDLSDDDEDTDSESDSSEEETVVARQVRPAVKVEADSTTESVPDAILRSRVSDQDGVSSVLRRTNDPFDGILDAVMPRQLDGPPENAQPFNAIFDAFMGIQPSRAQIEENDSDDDIELVNEYNLNPW